MKQMDLFDVVMKINGPVNPIGESNTDEHRLKNLESLTELCTKIVQAIDSVQWDNRNRHEHSIKKAAEFAGTYLTESLGIKD